MSEQPPAPDPATLRWAAERLGTASTMRWLYERESCDWWGERPVAEWLRELAAQAEEQAATPPDVRETASLIEGEVWGWLNRADAPWSPSDKTVADLTFAVARALAAAGVLASTPRPEGETRAATQIAEAERLLALAESTDWTSKHEPYRAPAIAAAQAYATLAVAKATLAAARAAVPPVEQDGGDR